MQNFHVIINHVLERLFAAEGRRLQKSVDRIHRANEEANRGAKFDGFLYQGKAYLPSHMAGVAGASGRKTLHLSVWPDMQAHLADQAQIDQDRAEIRQVLFRLFDPCHCPQHVRDAVPDCIADTLPPELAGMDRLGGPSWRTLRDLRQYNKALPKIEFYSAARLLY